MKSIFVPRPNLATLGLTVLGLAACGPDYSESEGSLPVGELSSELIFSNPTTTGWSGRSGSRIENLNRPVTENDALVGVTAGERSDDPCYLRALFDDVNGGTSSDTSSGPTATAPTTDPTRIGRRFSVVRTARRRPASPCTSETEAGAERCTTGFAYAVTPS